MEAALEAKALKIMTVGPPEIEQLLEVQEHRLRG